MKSIGIKQDGFVLILIVLVIVVVTVALGFVGFNVINNRDQQMLTSHSTVSEPGTIQQPTVNKVPAKIKHLGVNLDYYDPATNKAGDFLFTKAKLSEGMLFTNFGYVVTASQDFKEKRNPQPTFILPPGTAVHALVDGVVYDVAKLYSGDYSVMVQGDGGELIFETEHVINPKVKKGDRVKAGDVVAEVSTWDSQHNSGMGMVEIGVLKGGNPPSHLCPFDYLDDSIKDKTLKMITALQKSWEEYRGSTTIYNESQVVTPGCLTHDAIEG